MTSCLRIWQKIVNLVVSVTEHRRLRSSDIDTCLAQRTNIHLCDRSFAAAGSRRMEQSANPAVRVGHYTRTISTSTHDASIWSLGSCSAEWQCFSCAVYKLAYFLTYLLNYRAWHQLMCNTKTKLCAPVTLTLTPALQHYRQTDRQKCYRKHYNAALVGGT